MRVVRWTVLLATLVPFLSPAQKAPHAGGAGKWTLKSKSELVADGVSYRIETTTKISGEHGTRYYLAGKSAGYFAGVFAVHIPASYSPSTPMPMIVSSHGNGGSGIGDIKGWISRADKHGFIAVCPSFGSAVGNNSPGADIPMLDEIMERVLGSMKVDRHSILGTGFSGGGLPAYICMMGNPSVFTALCFRGANFYGMATKSVWKTRPIYILWGENDHPSVYEKKSGNGQGPAALTVLLGLKDATGEYRKRKNPVSFVSRDRSFKWDQIPGGGHDGRADLVVQWFVETVLGRSPAPAAKPEADSPDAPDEPLPSPDGPPTPPKPHRPPPFVPGPGRA